MIRRKIKNLIKKSIKELQKKKRLPDFLMTEIKVGRPEEKILGDYTSNIALMIGKEIKKNPLEIAENLKSQILKLKSELFEKIEVAKPGFINFFLSREYLQKILKEIMEKKEKFSQINLGKGKKIQVEFISANPTGPLTVGNARGGPFGDTLANVLKKAGFKVKKAYYINDYGKQILELGHSVLKNRMTVYKGDYIDKLAKKIKTKDSYKAGQKAAKIILEDFIKKTVKKMGIKFDEWFFESKLHKTGKVDKVLETLKKKKLTYEKDGALWFKSSLFGDKRDRVLLKKDGQKTYLAGDITYHQYKFEIKKFDKVINIWGADHIDEAPGLKAGISALGHKGKLDFVFLQFVTLFEKKEKLKMSKRLGVYISMDKLLKEIPLDVIRFFFLQKSPDTHLNFDLDLAKEQSEKNPVYYIQYAHARICSIFKKCKIQNIKYKITNQNLELLNHPSELNLIKQMIRLPEIIEDTAKDYQVQRIPQFALDLATALHRFYRDCKVLREAKSLLEARLALILATKIILKNTLSLMGISTPEKM